LFCNGFLLQMAKVELSSGHPFRTGSAMSRAFAYLRVV
jgi:hypothetical protein